MKPPKCSMPECGRERTTQSPEHLMDCYDYNAMQALTGLPFGWYSGDDGEVCRECMERTVRNK